MELCKSLQCVAIVTGGMLATSAHSQSLLDLTIDELMAIPVTSTSFFEASRLTSASSAIHLESGYWQARGSRTPGELLNTLPSTFAPPTNGGTRAVGIRGFFGINTGLSLRLDGIPLNQLRPSNSLEDIEGYDLSLLQSVEQIRGPGSAMHGADAFLGTLSLQTLQPDTRSTTARASLGTGEYGATSLSQHWHQNNHQITAAVAYRGWGDQDIPYPYTDPVSGVASEGSRATSLENSNLLLKYQTWPDPTTRLYATLYLMQLDADQLPGPGRGATGTSFLKDQDYSNTAGTAQVVKVGLEQTIDDDDTWSAFAYGWRQEHEFTGDFRDTVLGILNQEHREESRHGMQILNRHVFSDGAQLAFGYEFSEARLEEQRQTVIDANQIVLQNNALLPESGYRRRVHSLIVDGRLETGLLDTSLVYGARFDDYNDFDHQFSPRVGLLHSLDDDRLLKLLYGHAYRAPNLFEMFGNAQLLPNRDLQAEKMDTLELVYQQQGQLWFSSLTLFKNWWDDAIRGSVLPGPTVQYQFTNTGKNESHGLEAETLWHWQQHRLNLTASWARGKNLDSGENFSAFPEWIVDVGWGVQFDPHWDLFINNRLMLRDAASAPPGTGYTTAPARDFWRTDLTLSWFASATLTARAAIHNLFDRTNYLPSYLYHEAGIPDDRRSASIELHWYL